MKNGHIDAETRQQKDNDRIFTVVANGEEFVVEADSKDHATEWINAIRSHSSWAATLPSDCKCES